MSTCDISLPVLFIYECEAAENRLVSCVLLGRNNALEDLPGMDDLDETVQLISMPETGADDILVARHDRVLIMENKKGVGTVWFQPRYNEGQCLRYGSQVTKSCMSRELCGRPEVMRVRIQSNSTGITSFAGKTQKLRNWMLSQAADEKILFQTYDPYCEAVIKHNDPHTQIYAVPLLGRKIGRLGFKLPIVRQFDQLQTVGNRYFFQELNPEAVMDEMECYQDCNYGSAIVYHFDAPHPIWNATFELSGACKWMKVCFNTGTHKKGRKPMCDPDYAIDISLKHSFIIFPEESQSTFPARSNPPHYMVRVQNARAEYTESKFSHDATPNMLFMFERDTCLLNAPMSYCGTRYAFKKKAADEKYPVIQRQDCPVARSGPGGTGIQRFSARTIVHTTTEDPNAIEERALKVLMAQMEQKAIKGKWKIWGMGVGFAAGVIISTIVGGLILYAGRRSFYQLWYREMYRRYGAGGGRDGETGSTTMTSLDSTVGGATTMATSADVGETTMGVTGTPEETEFTTVKG